MKPDPKYLTHQELTSIWRWDIVRYCGKHDRDRSKDWSVINYLRNNGPVGMRIPRSLRCVPYPEPIDEDAIAERVKELETLFGPKDNYELRYLSS
jgi:hypothetical protein